MCRWLSLALPVRERKGETLRSVIREGKPRRPFTGIMIIGLCGSFAVVPAVSLTVPRMSAVINCATP